MLSVQILLNASNNKDEIMQRVCVQLSKWIYKNGVKKTSFHFPKNVKGVFMALPNIYDKKPLTIFTRKLIRKRSQRKRKLDSDVMHFRYFKFKNKNYRLQLTNFNLFI